MRDDKDKDNFTKVEEEFNMTVGWIVAAAVAIAGMAGLA